MKYIIINNEQLMHFEIHQGDDTGFLKYRYHNNSIAFMHTEVPASIEGRGVASALAQHAFKYAKEQHKKVKIYCPFVSIYLKRHPELSEQLDKR